MTTTTTPLGESAATPDAVAMTPSAVDAAGVAPRGGRSARRSFTAEYDAAPVGSKGAVLRRERLYDSHVTEWRAQITAGTLGHSDSTRELVTSQVRAVATSLTVREIGRPASS